MDDEPDKGSADADAVGSEADGAREDDEEEADGAESDVESREEIEDALDGFVPLAREGTDGGAVENGRDEPADVPNVE